jgi:hypothetical protein
MMWESALLDAIKEFKSIQKFSENLGVPRENVSSWLNKNIEIPLKYAFCIESMTQGRISWKSLVMPYIVRMLKPFSFSIGPKVASPYIQISLSIDCISLPIVNKPPLPIEASSIKDLCLGVDENNQIIFGEILFYYYQQCGKKTIPVWRISLSKLCASHYDPESFVCTFSLCERGRIGIALKNYIGTRRGGFNPEKFPEWKGKESREIIALYLGFGNAKTYQQIERIVTAGSPLLQRYVNEKKIAISTAAWLTLLHPEKQENVLSNSKKEIIALAQQLKQTVKQKNSH